MKVVALLVVLAAVFASAQEGLQYEQAAYADNAAVEQAPADFDEEETDEESSFVEEEGPFSDLVQKTGKSIDAVKKIWSDRKNNGFTIGQKPKPRPVAPPRKPSRRPSRNSIARAVNKAVKRAVTAPVRKLTATINKALKKPLIARRPGRRPSRGPSRRRPSRRPLASPRPAKFDNLWHYERHIPKGSENNDPEMAKLNLALEAVKEDILSTNKQINDERRWSIAVSKIISSYNSKMKRVEAHIIALRKEMKNLYRKKKQIENLKLQKALEAKLKEARAELATLTNSLKHVAVKQGELNKSGRDLRQTIAGIQGQLAKLRGQQLHKAKKCRWGRRYNLMKRKCVRICKKGQRLSKKTKKCVARKCKGGKKWDKKSKKCVKKSKKGKKAKKF